MKSYADAIDFLNARNEHRMDLTLDRMHGALQALGNPHLALASIHIAGTNGKGSTAAFLESIFRHSGFQTGLYTSPHVIDCRERIQVNRSMISEAEFLKVMQKIEKIAINHQLTYFEIMTLMAFVHFNTKKVQIAIYETGLGGRLDATNVVKPVVSIITHIALDHQKWLGPTIATIAQEKCGIIKKSGCVMTPTSQSAEALDTIKEAASRLCSQLRVVPPLPKSCVLGLAGEHQYENAALAVSAACYLMERGWTVSAIQKGLACTGWPGRLEKIHSIPPIIIDAAHNPDGAFVLRNYLREHFPGKQSVMLFGGMKDKDLREMISILDECAATWIFTKGDETRFESPQVLTQMVAHTPFFVSERMEEALALARIEGKKSQIIVAGSLYLIGKLKGLL